MPTISFRMDSIRAERYNFDPIQHLNINMNIMFSKPIKKDNTHIVEFIVKIDCIPPIASINLKGAVYITPIDQNEAKRIEEDLSNSTPPQQLFITVYSYTLPMIALLSRELGLPPPIQIPLSSREEKEGKHYHM
ncbi:MAG: hypothetical protein QW101_03175 [Ignisphaera sp.]|uniref:Preprotein translocase subunit SecB n=2 Tax=Ignisphaera aggregans TaxID=334771 RepID=A0A832AQF4_9CREN